MQVSAHGEASPRPPADRTKTDMAVSNKKKAPIHYPFWFGGSSSSMAACVTHPLDLGEQSNALPQTESRS
jgi:dicarboxylate transporter 10